MIITAYTWDRPKYSELFEQMFKLRAAAFSERRKWQVEVVQGFETDRFDLDDPLYVMSVSDTGELRATLRLLPTTAPHMISDVFPETMAEAPMIRHPLVWESTRFCVNTQGFPERTETGFNSATGELLVALFEVSHLNAITNVVSVYDVFMERILRRAGCAFERLAPPVEYGGLKTIAGVAPVSQQAIIEIREKTGINYDIFASNNGYSEQKHKKAS